MDNDVGSYFSSMQYLVNFYVLSTLILASKGWLGRVVKGAAALTVN